MTELGTRLSQASEASFAGRLKNDSKLKRIARRARDSTSYEVANEYAVRVGELASESIVENVEDLAFISEEVAREVLTPMLTADHDLITEVSVQIQKNMNAANGYGIEALAPELDTNRIEGLVKKVASCDTTEDALWILKEPVINYSQAVVDQAIRKNFDANSRMGIEAKIVRKAEASGIRYKKRGNKTYAYRVPCRWCQSLEGTYDYADVRATGSDVYRRHENCRCEVTYIQGKQRQDVWSKAEWTDKDSAMRADFIREKTEEKQREELRRAQERVTRAAAVNRVMKELHYSPKGASIWYNVNKDKIAKYGLDYMIAVSQS